MACLALTGCAIKHSPTPDDTKFKESQRDWLKIYGDELKIAVENDDKESQYFFIQEIMKMQFPNLPPNPNLKILNQ